MLRLPLDFTLWSGNIQLQPHFLHPDHGPALFPREDLRFYWHLWPPFMKSFNQGPIFDQFQNRLNRKKYWQRFES